jgi:UDP-N-acetylmuramate dehydrogenase
MLNRSAPPLVAQPLSTMTTLRLGGPADELVDATEREQLYALVSEREEAGIPTLVLGAGSNLVIADEGFPGSVVRVRNAGIEHDPDVVCAGAVVTVEAGMDWDEFVVYAIEQEWVGIEALSGIPGTVGAVPVQNVGAYGQEVAQTISQVYCWDRERGLRRTFAWGDCGFGYRTSVFKQQPDRYVVGAVEFQFRRGTLGTPIAYQQLADVLGVAVGTRVPAAAVRRAVLDLRRAKGMVLDPADHDTWSAGSFFTNPLIDEASLPAGAPSWPQAHGRVKTSAAWLMEQSGFERGYGSGPVRVSSKHALALTNRGGGTTSELLALATEIVAGVESRFGIRLEPEPRLVNCTL